MQDVVKQYQSGVDVLSELPEQDTVMGLGGDFPLADTISGMAGEGSVSFDSLMSVAQPAVVESDIYRAGDAAEVFGQGSFLAEGVSVTEDAVVQGLSSAAIAWPDVMLNLFIVVISVLYIFCIYRYYYDVIALIQTIVQRDVMVSERINERRRSDIFYGFLGKLLLLGVGFVGLFVAIWAVRHSAAVVTLGQQQQLLSPIVGVGLFVAVAIMQYLILFIVGLVTHSLAMASALTQMRLTYFVLATIVVAPPLLLAEVASTYHAWYVIAIVTACIVLVLYLRKSLGAFISKKISILHWILYLCTVEILPLTLLWQIAVRLG